MLIGVFAAFQAVAQEPTLSEFEVQKLALEQERNTSEVVYAARCAELIGIVARIKSDFDKMDEDAISAIHDVLDGAYESCTDPAIAYVNMVNRVSEHYLAYNQAIVMQITVTSDIQARRKLGDLMERNFAEITVNSDRLGTVRDAISLPEYFFN